MNLNGLVLTSGTVAYVANITFSDWLVTCKKKMAQLLMESYVYVA